MLSLRLASPRLDSETTLADILKPCPGCHDEPIVDLWVSQQFGEAFVQCLLCGHSGPVGRTVLDACDGWNRESASNATPAA
jgi:hypothetical protein